MQKADSRYSRKQIYHAVVRYMLNWSSFPFLKEDTDVSGDSPEDEYIRKTSLPPPRKECVSLEYLTLLMLQDIQVDFATSFISLPQTEFEMLDSFFQKRIRLGDSWENGRKGKQVFLALNLSGNSQRIVNIFYYRWQGKFSLLSDGFTYAGASIDRVSPPQASIADIPSQQCRREPESCLISWKWRISEAEEAKRLLPDSERRSIPQGVVFPAVAGNALRPQHHRLLGQPFAFFQDQTHFSILEFAPQETQSSQWEYFRLLT